MTARVTATGAGAFGQRLPLLCVVTDRTRLGTVPPASTRDAIDALVAQAAAAADAGLDLFQLREPDLPDAALVEIAERAREAATGSPLRVLLNDRLDIALAAGVHGVHLRGASFSAARARTIVPARVSAAAPAARAGGVSATQAAGAAASAGGSAADSGEPFLIGRSVHSAEEAAAAEAAGGLDYLILGAMFPTASKPPDHPLAGLETLRAAVSAGRLPILAIGGMTLENAAAVAEAGAAGLAAIGLFAAPRTMRDTAVRLRRIFAAAPRRA